MGRAILASAAISGLVLPIELGGRIATDGGWVRNFPFEHAYRNPEVAAIAGFRYIPSYPATDPAFLERTRERLDRFRAVPPVRALLAEVRLAQERAARGEPAHYGELIVRLMRVAFARNAVVEERLAAERDDLRRRAAQPTRGRDARSARSRSSVAAQAPRRRARRALRRRALPLPARPPATDARRPGNGRRTRPRLDASAPTRRGRTNRSAPWSSAAMSSRTEPSSTRTQKRSTH